MRKRVIFRKKANLFEFGSFEKDGKENLIFFQKPPIDKKSLTVLYLHVFSRGRRGMVV